MISEALLSATTRWRQSGVGAIGLVLVVGMTTPACAQFVPNESLVSPNPALIDFEFSQSRAKFAWTDPTGVLWLGGVNRATGAFEPSSGKGQQIATNTVSKWNMFMWNGPEWLAMASGDQIFYSFYLPGKQPLAINTRMALAVQNSSGDWVTQTLSPPVPRMSHIASKNPGDTNPTIKYLDPQNNQYWRNALDPSSGEMLSFLPASTKSWRFASGVRALMYASPVNGVSQVFRYMLDTRVSEQLTFDDGAKDLERTVPWMWQAPEFDGDFVFSTVVNSSEVRIYRQFANTTTWTKVFSFALPPGRSPGSPEYFTFNGKSYVFMVAYVDGKEYPSEVWITNIDASNPKSRRINDDALERARNDPEVFITSDYGPLIYYNRYDPSKDPSGDHPLCQACAEGVYRSNPGLKPPPPQ